MVSSKKLSSPQGDSVDEITYEIEQVLAGPERLEIITSIAQNINFDNVIEIGKYGSIENEKDSNFSSSADSVIHAKPLTTIAQLIENLVTSLKAADPRLLQKVQPWYKSFMGKDLTEKVSFCTNFYNIDNLLQQVPAKQKGVEGHLTLLSEVKTQYLNDIEILKNHLIAGTWFLQAYPMAGIEENSLPGLESSRDRFSRRLNHLQAMISSSDLAVRQVALIEANTLSMLDRLHEITSVLIPSWRNRSAAIRFEESLDVASIEQATNAHDQLLTSLSDIGN